MIVLSCGVSDPCGPGGWYYYEKSCYHLGPPFVQQAYTWSQARKYCQAKNSDLLVPSSEAEFNSIKSLVAPFNHDLYVYLGYYYSTSKGSWDNSKNGRNYRMNIATKADTSLYNVTALYMQAKSVQNGQVVVIPDSTKFLNSSQTSFLVLFVCQKSKRS